jgi:CheY-like chemotaxis protein
MKTRINPAGLGPLTALIVEDNEHMRILLRTVLKAFGIREIHECKEGAEALRFLKAKKPDFVLTDLAMAPMDGLHFTRAVRALPEKEDCVLPIIMVTGYTERRRVQAARDAGVTEILAKPVTPSGLFQRVEEIIMRPRAFVRTPDYSGPSRRRHSKPDYVGPWRRKDDTDLGRETVALDNEETGPVRSKAGA